MKLTRMLLGSTLLSAGMGSQTAWAQVGPPTSAGATGSAVPERSGKLEEIVVTARKRAENLQSTPVSITAFSPKRLAQMDVRSEARIADFTPGLQLIPLPGSSGIGVSLRGISVTDSILTNEPSIGIYIDGVYTSPIGSGFADLLNISDVEVLRGPQGTLFGRNTTGGAVVINTARPSTEFGVDTDFSYGSFNDLLTRTTVNTGDIIPGWRAMFTYQYRSNDGWVNNTLADPSHDPGASISDSARAALHGEIGPVSIDYTFDIVHRRDVPLDNQVVATSSLFGDFVSQSPALGGGALQVSRNYLSRITEPVEPHNKGDSDDQAVTVTYNIDPSITLKSITGYRDFSDNETYRFGTTTGPNAGLVLPILNLATFGETDTVVEPDASSQIRGFHQWSEEFQLSGTLPRLHYTAGFYYYDFVYHEQQPQLYPEVFTVPYLGAAAILGATDLAYHGTTRSYAEYGQASYTPPILQDKLEVTVGVRHTNDDKSVDINLYPNGVPPALTNGAVQSFSNTSYNVTLDYKIIPDVFLYGRIGTGYRAGGFNARSFDGKPYLPEEATVYELGIKSELLDHRLRLNADVFHTDYNNYQTGTTYFSPLAGYVSTTVNAGKATYNGFEAEATVKPTDGLTFLADAAYVDPEFKSFVLDGVDYTHQAQFANLARFQAHAGFIYDFPPMSYGTVTLSSDYSYKSHQFFTIFENAVIPNSQQLAELQAENQLSARITLSNIKLAGRATGSIALFGENLLNQHYRVEGVDFGGLGYVAAFYNRPLFIGVDARAHF